jgi:hypothetical protein
MRVLLDTYRCTVRRDKTDPKFYRESTFLHHVKKKLIEQGYDVIKKRMWRDGHMVDDTQQYIRDRKNNFAIWYGEYAIRDSREPFNENGEVVLLVERWTAEN